MPFLRPATLAAFLAVPLCGCLPPAAQAAPVTYTILGKLSRVSFNLEHQGFIQLFGTLRVAPGSFVFDDQDWSKSAVEVSMPVASLDMGDTLWNGQIRGDEEWARLFKTQAITFRSTRVERSDATHGTLHGELTLAGITRPVALQMRVNKIGLNDVSEKPSIGISATATVKRSQFGLDAYSDLVGDDITVQIQVEGFVGKED